MKKNRTFAVRQQPSVMENFHFGPYYNLAEAIAETDAFGVVMPVLAIVSMIALAFWTLFEKDDCKQSTDRLFITACIAVIFIFRSLTFYTDIGNPDEAHILAPTLNFLAVHELWTAADSTTIGPLCLLTVATVIKLFELVGIHLDPTFFLVRVITFFLIACTSTILYRIFRKNLTKKTARTLLLFFVFFFSFGFHHDLIGFNTEYIYLLIITLICLLRYSTGRSLTSLFWFSLLCGMLPFVKIQTVPMMIPCIGWIVWQIWQNRKNRLAIKQSFVAIGGLALPSILLLTYCSTYDGGLQAFYKFYILNASAHTLPVFSMDFAYSQYRIIRFFVCQYWYNSLFILILLTLIILIIKKIKPTEQIIFYSTLLLFSLLAIARPGTTFSHYMIFVSIPALLFFMSVVNKYFVKDYLFVGLWFIIFGGFVCNVIAQVKILKNDHPVDGVYWTVLRENGMIGKSRNFKKYERLSEYILENTAKDDYILVWGWASEVYVYTGRKSAASQPDIARLWGDYAGERGYPHFNVDKYIADIRLRKPKLIIDVITNGSFYFYGDRYKLENHTEIWNAIKNEYHLSVEFPNPGGSYRIYSKTENEHN